jgi:hypothetical protein
MGPFEDIRYYTTLGLPEMNYNRMGHPDMGMYNTLPVYANDNRRYNSLRENLQDMVVPLVLFTRANNGFPISCYI